MFNLPIVLITFCPNIDILKRNITKKYKYIVIDNSFTSEELILELSKFKNIEIIANKANIGIAKALNQGAERAIELGYSWVLTMDQDSIIDDNIISSMISFLEKRSDKKNIAVLSPRHLLQQDATIKVDDETREYTKTINVMTSGNLLNLNIWKKIGGFEEKLFIDMVDLEYNCRCAQNGYKVIMLNHVIMPHSLGNLQVKRLFGKEFKIMNHNYIRKYYQTRNTLYTYFKYKTTVPEVYKSVKFLLGVLVTTIIFEDQKLKKLYFMARGFIDFCRNKYGKLNVDH